MLALPIFPASHPASIVGEGVLNFCVRDGNRWTHSPINTNYIVPYQLGYYTTKTHKVKRNFGDPYGIRTHVNGVRGRCLNHLTNGPYPNYLYIKAVWLLYLVRPQGLEPGTH